MRSTHQTSRLFTLVLAVITVVLFSLVPIAIKAVSANPFTIGLFRISLTLVVFSVLLRNHLQFGTLTFRDYRSLLLIGALFAGHWYTYFFSIKIASPSIAIIGVSTYGLFLMFFSRWVGHSKLDRVDLLLVIIAILGIVIIVPKFSLEQRMLPGLSLAIISGAFFGALPILHQKNAHIALSTRTFFQFFGALLLFLPTVPLTDFNLSHKDWLLLIFLALGGTLIAHTIWVHISTQLSPTVISTFYYANVPITMILSGLLLKEQIQLNTWVGALMIVAANLASLVRLNRAD